MEKILILISFLPWLLCYMKESLYYTKKVNHRNYSFNYIKKEILESKYIYKIILLGIYVYFYTYEISTLNSAIFIVISISLLLINRKNKTSLKAGLNTIKTLIGFCISAIPFIYYYLSDDIANTYIILIIYISLTKYITILVDIIYKQIKKII